MRRTVVGDKQRIQAFEADFDVCDHWPANRHYLVEEFVSLDGSWRLPVGPKTTPRRSERRIRPEVSVIATGLNSRLGLEDVAVTINLSNIDQPVTIAAPTGVVRLSPQMLKALSGRASTQTPR